MLVTLTGRAGNELTRRWPTCCTASGRCWPGLDRRERRQLADLMRTLLVPFDNDE